jgi:IS30 family transposase
MAQITYEQRYAISILLKQGNSQKSIAEAIGKHPSVISRELRRNCDLRGGNYDFDLAERKCRQRHHTKFKHIKMTPMMIVYINDKLSQKLSPEQIVGLSKINGIECVSHERIYQHVWLDKKRRGNLHKDLRSKGKPYSKRGSKKTKRSRIPNRIDIDERPKFIEERKRFGDLEIDTIVGKDHKSSILTINDRMTGLLRIGKLANQSSLCAAEKAIELLSDWKPLLKTITADNGMEFTHHQLIAKELLIDFYFAKPYHSWERGSNENLNGLIRQYIPKKTDFNTITDEFVTFVENELNNRPRKRFEFLSPIEVFNQKVAFIT